MNPELINPEQLYEKPKETEALKTEALRSEVIGAMENNDALRNTLVVLKNAGLEAFKSIFKKS